MSIAINLAVYTGHFMFAQNGLLLMLAGINWAFLAVYAVFTEIVLNITQNSTLNSEKISNNIFNLNIIATSLFLLIIALLSGNKDYLFLCIIPVFQTILEKKTKIAGIILGVSAVVTLITELSNWFDFYLLPVNQIPAIYKSLSFLVVFGVLSSLGFVLAKTLTFTKGKADYMHSIATTDALTGLLNRREFNLRLSEEFARAKRHKSPLSLALFDIDFFKKINDTHGHNTGDAILKELGLLIASKTRTCDIAARYGGEEFALILPETSQSDSYELMDRLRYLVETEIFNKTKLPVRATISIGVAQLDFTDKTPLDFCERTDKALYKAKESGRNRVEKAPFGISKITLSKSYKVV